MAQDLNKIEQAFEDDFLDNIEEGDFVFIVDRNGVLKTILCPEDESTETSDGILKIMQSLGIDLHETHTLH
jgi:alkyl hydroperoxide reductase subunit AhpC